MLIYQRLNGQPATALLYFQLYNSKEAELILSPTRLWITRVVELPVRLAFVCV